METQPFINQGGIAIGTDGRIYIPDNSNERILALNPEDGSKKWEFSCDDYPGLPSVEPDGTLYFSDGDLNAVSSDGSQLWEYDIQNGYAPKITIDNNGVIYGGNWTDKKYMAINSDETLRWENDSVTHGYHHSTSISSKGVIYISSWKKESKTKGILAVQGGASLESDCWPRGFAENRNSGRY